MVLPRLVSSSRGYQSWGDIKGLLGLRRPIGGVLWKPKQAAATFLEKYHEDKHEEKVEEDKHKEGSTKNRKMSMVQFLYKFNIKL